MTFVPYLAANNRILISEGPAGTTPLAGLGADGLLAMPSLTATPRAAPSQPVQ
jgi:hypothetical protein